MRKHDGFGSDPQAKRQKLLSPCRRTVAGDRLAGLIKNDGEDRRVPEAAGEAAGEAASAVVVDLTQEGGVSGRVEAAGRAPANTNAGS